MHKFYRKKTRSFRPTCIVIILILLMSTIAIGYSYYSTELNIKGTATASYNYLPVRIQVASTDGGVTRYTSSSDFTTGIWPLKRTYFEVDRETFDQETATLSTNVHQLKNQIGGTINDIDPDISFTIINISGKDFTNGKIEEVNYRDSSGALHDYLNKWTIPSLLTEGSSATIKFNGKLRGKDDTDFDTFHQFKITYQCEGHEYVFWYYLTLTNTDG